MRIHRSVLVQCNQCSSSASSGFNGNHEGERAIARAVSQHGSLCIIKEREADKLPALIQTALTTLSPLDLFDTAFSNIAASIATPTHDCCDFITT